jgi:uncharacterized protein (TIGR03435 family)
LATVGQKGSNMRIRAYKLCSRQKFAAIFAPFLFLLFAIAFAGIAVLRAQSREPSVPAANRSSQPGPTSSEAVTSATAQPPAQSANPDWEATAGGKKSFEVASVKWDKSGPQVRPTSNFPLNASDVYPRNGGLLSATNYPAIVYIIFAYKLETGQAMALMSTLPNWAKQERFDIQAKAEDSPTKDQMRLMMQSLLADRFKLAIRKETKEGPVYDLMLEKPGKLGPQIMMRPANVPCKVAAPVTPSESVPAPLAKRISTMPIACGTAPRSLPTEEPGAISWAAGRDFTAAQLAGLLSVSSMANRPVIDRTGITDRFDFILYWEPVVSVEAQPELSAPPFMYALKSQLGLKLVAATGSVSTFVIDHIEEPTPN